MAFDIHDTNVYERVQRTVNTIQFGSSPLGCMHVWNKSLCIIRLLCIADYLNMIIFWILVSWIYQLNASGM